MLILGIESSCDETSAAILQGSPSTCLAARRASSGNIDRVQILSNVVASSADLQAKYGGIIPEQAAREQLKSIIPVITEAMKMAQVTSDKLDAIAVTEGPGLIGSLLVGVETAKVLARIWNKPLIPVNHLLGHFYANWITPIVIPAQAGIQFNKQSHGSRINPLENPLDSLQSGMTENVVPKFPAIGLLVSGGHTDLVLFTDHNKYQYLGGTRDDAAGECFDKCARLLGLPYPGGPQISKLAKLGNPQAFDLPRPMLDSKDWDFSFSGLKTAVANLIKNTSVIPAQAGIQLNKIATGSLNPRNDKMDGSRINPLENPLDSLQSGTTIANLCASIEAAIVDVLVKKTIVAAQKYQVEQIIVAGGVAANQKLVSDLQFKIQSSKFKMKISVPPPNLCTDNAAMIAAAAFYTKPTKNLLTLQANPNLSLAY